jgi:hypothetical protein
MTHLNPTDPAHRIDNYRSDIWFIMYAEMLYRIEQSEQQDYPLAFLKGVAQGQAATLAIRLDIAQTTIVGALRDAGRQRCAPRAAQDEAATPTA